jgi:predicted Zn-dependent protease
LRERPLAHKELLYHALAPLYTGDFEVAEKRLAEARAHFADEPYIISLQGMLQAQTNRPDMALESVRLALDSPKSLGHTHHTHHHIACVYAILGQTEKAMAWLDRTVNNGLPCWSFFRIDPHLANLRGDSGFERLMADLERKYSAIEIRRL